MSFLVSLVAQLLAVAGVSTCTENYPGQRQYQRYVVQPHVELPAGILASDEVLVIRDVTEWQAMRPTVIHAISSEWRGKAFIMLGPKRHPISCGRHGFEVTEDQDLVLHLFPPTESCPPSGGGCLIELPFQPRGKVSVDGY